MSTTMIPLIKESLKNVGRLQMLAASVILLASAPSLMNAQTWEYTYGSPTRVDDGKFRVIPVTGSCTSPSCCPGSSAGYIAVGTSYPGPNDPQNADVHVVRTTNNGGPIWEYTYDITGNNDWDYGWSVIECANGSGFVITGESQIGGTNVDLFLLKIDCNGGVVWSRTYGSLEVEGGRDLVEATSGNAGFGTSAGDIIAAGYTLGSGAGSPDGYLLRVRANGTLIWDAAYNYQPTLPPGEFDFFHSLTEMTAPGGTTTKDILAVGFTDNNGVPATMQSLAVRVNGDNGAIGVAPQGAATYGFAGAVDQFWSVIKLNGSNDAVITGDYMGIGIHAVRLTGGNPATPATARSITSTTAGTALWGRTVRQVTFVPGAGSVAQNDLVVTGTQVPAGGTPRDMLLLSLNPNTLVPGALAATYGGNGDENGWSVYPVAANGGRTFGFVLCGDATSWGAGFGAQDMFLVKTDGFGAVGGCEHGLNVNSASLTGVTPITMNVATIGPNTPRSTVRTSRTWDQQICFTSSLIRGEFPDLGFSPVVPEQQ